MRYSSPDLAARAIEVLNGSELEGRKLHVREDRTYIDSAEGVVVFVVRACVSCLSIFVSVDRGRAVLCWLVAFRSIGRISSKGCGCYFPSAHHAASLLRLPPDDPTHDHTHRATSRGP